MRKALAVVVSGIVSAGLFSAVHAEPLPKSGSISFHTGWRDLAEAVQVADKHLQGHARDAGITFNDKGSGPLHLGPANCFGAFHLTDGVGPVKGYCAFGDIDGDRIFTDFSGNIGAEGANGTNVISGGTGKYAGASGNGPWKCKFSGSNGELQCTQRLDYRLP